MQHLRMAALGRALASASPLYNHSDRHIPWQRRLLLEDGFNPFSQVCWKRDLFRPLGDLARDFCQRFLGQLRRDDSTCLLLDDGVAGDQLGNTMRSEAGLDEVDKLATRHCVQLDAAGAQKI